MKYPGLPSLRLAVLLALCCAAPVEAATGDKAAPPLTLEQRNDASAKVIVPLSADIFNALDQLDKDVNWRALVDYTAQGGAREKSSYPDNALKALNLGVRVADAFIAIQAKDAAALRSLSNTLVSLAQPLGVSEEIVGARETIERNARAGDKWPTVRDNVVALQEKVRTELEDQKRADEAVLVVVGGWLQGLHLVTKALSGNDYNADAATVLRQVSLVQSLQTQLNGLSAETKNLPVIQAILADLPEIAKLTAVGQNEPVSKANVEQLYKVSSKLAAAIMKG